MATFNTDVAHELGKEEALTRLKGFLEGVKQQYKDQVSELDGHWDDNVLTFSMTTYKIKIEGKLTVEDKSVNVQGTLPLYAAMFKGRIQQSITSELERELK